MDPQENLNPWWILFGYVPDRKQVLAGGNPSDYTLEGIDGVANAVDKATDLYTKMLSINTSS